jgi:hypothetical protein
MSKQKFLVFLYTYSPVVPVFVLTTVLAALVHTVWLNIPGAELPVILNTVL